MSNHPTYDRRSIGSRARCAPALVAALSFALALMVLSCGGKKESAPPKSEARSVDLTGTWRSDIHSGERTLSSAVYRIDQRKDSLTVRLLSTKTPGGAELVSSSMIFEARGEWRDGTARLRALYWISGKDSCTFSLIGKMDPEGRFLLFFPGDICGERSLPYTRTLQRADST